VSAANATSRDAALVLGQRASVIALPLTLIVEPLSSESKLVSMS
jgi:hypothetical protein